MFWFLQFFARFEVVFRLTPSERTSLDIENDKLLDFFLDMVSNLKTKQGWLAQPESLIINFW